MTRLLIAYDASPAARRAAARGLRRLGGRPSGAALRRGTATRRRRPATYATLAIAAITLVPLLAEWHLIGW